MKNQELITYIQFNIKDIYNNLTIVFGLENKEIKLLFFLFMSILFIYLFILLC